MEAEGGVGVGKNSPPLCKGERTPAPSPAGPTCSPSSAAHDLCGRGHGPPHPWDSVSLSVSVIRK